MSETVKMQLPVFYSISGSQWFYSSLFVFVFSRRAGGLTGSRVPSPSVRSVTSRRWARPWTTRGRHTSPWDRALTVSRKQDLFRHSTRVNASVGIPKNYIGFDRTIPTESQHKRKHWCWCQRLVSFETNIDTTLLPLLILMLWSASDQNIGCKMLNTLKFLWIDINGWMKWIVAEIWAMIMETT